MINPEKAHRDAWNQIYDDMTNAAVKIADMVDRTKDQKERDRLSTKREAVLDARGVMYNSYIPEIYHTVSAMNDDREGYNSGISLAVDYIRRAM